MKQPLVSIIIPAYNVCEYIGNAINSVLNQTYKNWELLIVNDGSTDATRDEIFKFSDRRIKYFEQENKGVSVARNLALANMQGDYFCFLDADDVQPENSIKSRLDIFKEKTDISFVDGKVIIKDNQMQKTVRCYIPSFRGYPYNELLKISDKCFFGLSWMIKREKTVTYLFNESMTHAEDLCFYLSISNGKKYDYTKDEVLYYRASENSAMSDFAGLKNGYQKLYYLVRAEHKTNHKSMLYLKYKICRIMFLSYLLDNKNPLKAFKVLIKYLLL